MKITHLLAKTVHFCFGLLPSKKIILFESRPDFSCNTYPVYLEMKKQERFNKYKLIWLTHENKTKDGAKTFFEKSSGVFAGIKKWYLFERSACFISCNSILTKRFPKQLSVFLSHGSKTKKTKGICEIGDSADYVMVQSHFFDDIIKYEYDLRDEQLAYCGYPRCDYLYTKDPGVKKALGISDSSKLIVWLPTFRKNVHSTKADASSSYNKIGMPVIYSIDDLTAFNDRLKQCDTYVIFKPHPSQDISELKATSLTNVIIIDDSVLFDKDIQLCQLLAVADSLITDYSSVYFDYLLLDRPIATTNDDADEWKNGRGFAFDLETVYDNTTERIGKLDELLAFIGDVNEGIDRKAEERNKFKELTNIYDDDNSAKRVTDFVYSKLVRKGK